ncbi:MAG: hypothetical protein HND52_01670 [Ignavibacteriae bacterium]|nr:hypothetical protein [Ignavibacteriota bacterium]NOG96659.1 hypothetical protein [Ignavibacteriota bacterium]
MKRNIESKIKIKNILFFIAAALIFLNGNITAQFSNYVSSVETSEAIDGESVDVTVNLLQNANIAKIIIAYRNFGATEYTESELVMTGLSAKGFIPGSHVKIPVVDYFLTLTFLDGSYETFPEKIFSGGLPSQIIVKQDEDIESGILILSPEKNEELTEDELLVSISLLRSSKFVANSATKIFIDNNDITENVLFADDLLLYRAANFPGSISPGKHVLKVVTFDNLGKELSTEKIEFTIKSTRILSSAETVFTYNADFRGESRNENYNSNSTWFNNLMGSFIGRLDDWKFKGRVYVTSEEKKYRQPQNRYFASVENEWLKVELGDNFPRYSKLILDGKRVRGISGGLYLGFLNLESSYGQLTRSIEGRVITPLPNSDTLGTNIIPIDPNKYGADLGVVSFGKYERDLTVIRPSFGSGEKFQLGFTYLHSKDKMNSIDIGTSPQENLVLGTDLMTSADDRRIILTAEAAINITNEDISTGTLTDSEIDTLFGGQDNFFDADPEDVKNIKNIVGNFITVNQFLNPLNPHKLSSFAAEAALELNYFDNSLKATYLYRGNDFRSFGQSFLRNDVAGFNIVDRMKLIQNKLFLSVTYERLQDNLQKTKISTTTYQTLNTSISFYPRADLPNVTVGYSRFENFNGLDTRKIDNGMYYVDEGTDKYLIQFSYNFDGTIRHNAYLSVVASEKKDYTSRRSDGHNLSTSLMLNSNWSSDLISFFNITYYNSDYSNIIYRYTTLSVGARYKAIPNKLEFSLNISPSFGDLERQAFDFLTTYYALNNLRIVLQARIFRIPDSSTNSIIGITSQWNI